jgi:trimeric autotransporter adhesin
MKKSSISLFFALIISVATFGQLTGTKTIPGDYASVAAAITALNTSGVGAGGVTFNVAAGYSETFTSLTAGLIWTTTGSATNPIVFQKSGAGLNPVITGFATAPGPNDYIICIGGTDYVTFDGIDVQELTGSVEWGYAILKASATDGSQNITIKNCKVNLNKTFTGTIGIYSNNHTTASTAQLTVTALTGANSNLKIFNNNISNCYFGIYIMGYNSATPYSFYDQNNEIGKDGANTITNVGGGTVEAYGIYTKYQNNLKVANNTITSTSAGTKNIYGIYLTTANNANLDLYSNTVTIQFTPTDMFGNANFYGIISDMGALGTTNVANVYNNSVINCNFSNSAASATTRLIYLLNLGVTANVYGNTVSNNTIGGYPGATAIGEIRYMWIQPSSTTKGPVIVHDNIVQGNTRIQSVQGGGLTYMMAISGSGTTLNAYNNTISNIILASNGGAYGLYVTFADVTSKDVYNNTITNISQANGSVSGIYNGSGVLGRFYKNKIQNIVASASATSAVINGIYHASAGATMLYYNNMISELSNPGAITTLGLDYNSLNGFYLDNSGTFKGFYNNTVYLNSTTNSTEFGSSAFCAFSLTGVDLRNNIFVNTSAAVGTNGKTVGIRSRSTTYTNFSSNYNNIYAGFPSPSNLIFSYGNGGTYITAQTLLSYKTIVTPNDLQSVTELSPFMNISSSPYDIHLQTNVPTKCEAGGFVVSTPLAITTDFDGDARFPNAGYPVNGSFTPNAPDIGADEFGGLPNDVTPPAIIYTPFTQTSSFLPRTLLATITDGTGVPTAGIGLPVLYWKLNNGAWQPVQATWVSGSTYSFTFGQANAYHDVISYYIVAQDMAPTPNVGAFPWQGASGFTANPPACSTPPTNPSSYLIIQDISGTFHVGVGKTYTTLSAAASDLNDKFMVGAVTFILDDNTYPSETFPILFNANPGNSATNLLVIKPNTGATPVISGSLGSSGLIRMNGLDYVTVDGSNNGTTTKDMTFENTSSAIGSYAFGITNNGGTDPSKNITLKNCILKGSITDHLNDTYVIVFNENGGTTGGGYDNILITNNTIMRAKYGIQIQGSAGNINHNITISNNIIGSSTPADYINRWGIDVEQSDNTLITGNDVMGPAAGTDLLNIYGIIYWNNSTNTKITKNKIHDWFSLGPGSWGIKCQNEASTTVTEISNNLIYNIKCYGMNPGTGSLIAYGIYIRDGGNMKIWNNTIYLSGPYLDGSDSYGPSSGCIGIQEWTTNLFDIRDNILRNSMTNPNAGASGSQGKAYGIMVNATSEANAAAKFSQLNYNDYYIDGFNGCIGQFYGTGGSALISYPTLASWQAFTGKEANGITDNPVFVSDIDPMDLHPTNMNLNSVGGPRLITTDFANSPRFNPTDMGAYEWSNLITDYHTLAATSISQNTATLNGDMNTKGEVVETYLEWGLTTAYGNYANASGYGNPPKVRTVSLVPVNSPITGLTPNTTYHFRLTGFPLTSAQTQIFGTDFSFTTLALPPAVITTAATSITSSGATLNGTVNPNGVSATVTFEYGLTTSYGSTVTATQSPVSGTTPNNVSAPVSGLQPNMTYHFRVVSTNNGGTTYGNDMPFTTAAINASVITNFANPVGTTTATLNGTVTANNATTTISFEWGPTTAYGNTIGATPATANGMTATAVSANISGLTINATYHFRCVGVNVAGTAYGLDQTFTTNCVAPVITISGPSTACAGSGGYVYTSQAGNSNYTWAVSAGGTITGGSGTNSITVTWNTSGAQTVSLNYQNTFGCSAPSPTVFNVVVNPLPVITISGPAQVCAQSSGNVYTTQAGNTNYQWTVNGGNITAGTGTNAITVTWNSTGTKTVSINYTNPNGCSAASPATYNVTYYPVPVPTITGYNNLCSGTGEVPYTTEAAMSNYTWTISSGGTIVSGQGTYQVQVSWNTAGSQWIGVNYSDANGCYALTPTIFNVTVTTVPGPAGTITGTASVCGGAQGIAYSVPAITNAQTYIWTLPAGATIASGEWTNNITVNFAANASSGNITVAGNNLCGNGTSSAPFAVTVNQLPEAAGTITGPAAVCQGTSGVTYSVGTIANATTYNWTVPAGATIVSGSTTNTITVDFGMNAVSGNITVYGSNTCGNGTVSPSFAVTVNPIPATPEITANGDMLTSSAADGNQWYFEGTMIQGATNQSYQATQSGWYWAVVTLNGCSSDTSNHVYIVITGIGNHSLSDSFTVYPNPNNGQFTILLKGVPAGEYDLEVINNIGQSVWNLKNVPVSGEFSQNIDIRPASKGLYTIIIRNERTHEIRKVLITK